MHFCVIPKRVVLTFLCIVTYEINYLSLCMFVYFHSSEYILVYKLLRSTLPRDVAFYRMRRAVIDNSQCFLHLAVENRRKNYKQYISHTTFYRNFCTDVDKVGPLPHVLFELLHRARVEYIRFGFREPTNNFVFTILARLGAFEASLQ